jgi:hypothetical protein
MNSLCSQSEWYSMDMTLNTYKKINNLKKIKIFEYLNTKYAFMARNIPVLLPGKVLIHS